MDMKARIKPAGRWFSLAGLVLAGVCFLLPFALVSCEAPGGYGRAKAGGTTTYTGFDLVTGDEPQVTETHLRPAGERQDDRLPPQPLAIAALVLIAAGAAAVVLFRDAGVRRPSVALASAMAAVFLAATALAVKATLEGKFRAQLTVPMPDGKSPGDYVHIGNGLWLAVVLSAVTAVGNVVAWMLRRKRSTVDAR